MRPRVVSLVPSATESLVAWGAEVVGCTRFCEQPAIPPVGGTKDPDLTAIVRLAPDLVVVDEEENRREDAEALTAAGLALHVLAVRSLDDVVVQLPALAAAAGVSSGALAGWTPTLAAGPRRTAWVPIWKRPWMALGPGTYGASLLAALGVDVVPGDRGRYPEVDPEQLRADVVLAPSEPYPFGERHRRELEVVAPATFVDGQDLVWWGARTPAAYERLARHLSTISPTS